MIRPGARLPSLGIQRPLAALLASFSLGNGAVVLGSAEVKADPSIQRLERSWQQLDQQLRTLDALLPSEPQSLPAELYATPPLPANLIRANQPATAPLKPGQANPEPPLALPSAAQLKAQGVQGLSLEQALAIAFASSANLQAQREQVAASLATLQAALGSWWPRISAVASGGSNQTGTSFVAPVGNGALGLGPMFSPNGLAQPSGAPTAGAFYVPNGGAAYFNQSVNQVEGGLELNYDLIDFARTPKIKAARAQLQQARHTYANTLRSTERITAPDGLGMSARRITVSTAGIAKMIRKLADDGTRFNLALSLHAANDAKRDRIMPINEQNSLGELKEALRYYTRVTRQPVTFEYILLRGFNDSLADAQELVKYASDVHAKVNLIEYNPIDAGGFGRTDTRDAEAFQQYLDRKGIIERIRRSRGRDIDAACGQLANKNEPALKEGEQALKQPPGLKSPGPP